MNNGVNSCVKLIGGIPLARSFIQGTMGKYIIFDARCFSETSSYPKPTSARSNHWSTPLPHTGFKAPMRSHPLSAVCTKLPAVPWPKSKHDCTNNMSKNGPPRFGATQMLCIHCGTSRHDLPIVCECVCVCMCVCVCVCVLVTPRSRFAGLLR